MSRIVRLSFTTGSDESEVSFAPFKTAEIIIKLKCHDLAFFYGVLKEWNL